MGFVIVVNAKLISICETVSLCVCFSWTDKQPIHNVCVVVHVIIGMVFFLILEFISRN